MRILTLVVVIAGALWGGYWYIGSTALQKAAVAAFANAREEGRVAQYSSLSVAGFPNRFDLTVNDIALGDPAEGVTWRAPFAQILSLSYTPYHVIAALPHRQVLELPGQSLTLTSQKMEGSVLFAPTPALRLKRTTFIAAQPELVSTAGWQVGLHQARFAARPVAGKENSYEIGFEALDIAPDASLKAQLDPEGKLPPKAEIVHLDGDLSFTAPLDRHAGETHPRLTALTLRDSHARWGDLSLTLKGALEIGRDGLPIGRITLSARHWQQMLDIAVALGLVKPEIAPTVRNMLTELAKGSGSPDTVELPLSFQKGWMSVGPLPLGPAPRFR
ncbi:DUF2125 domain-containing protein [Acidimangrovimonas pyrenivorans]|uniref:DUF2125 domain-containing protein n=1 Tax=Acidimangrovimonas pyrenivorans TaxID=2030798 RepID=A0ABV7AM57_9RHOB